MPEMCPRPLRGNLYLSYAVQTPRNRSTKRLLAIRWIVEYEYVGIAIYSMCLLSFEWHQSILVYFRSELPQQNIIRCWSLVVPHPLGLDAKEYPHPASNDFQKLHEENATF